MTNEAVTVRPPWRLIREGDARFWWAFLAWALLQAMLAGIALSLQMGTSVARFASVHLVPGVVALSFIRELGPGIATGAVFMALIVWAHRLEPNAVRGALPGLFARAAVALPLCLPAVVAVAGIASFAVLRK